MIPVKEQRDVVSAGVADSASFEISEEDAAHVMTILRDTLYSDKIMAVLREYSTNAWDAMREAGKGHLPIHVTLPTYADPTLTIRDDGPGLSNEGILRVYTKYGRSTKRGDNLAAGMLGIGSKSGFAYSDSFTVTSRYAGPRPADLEGPWCGFRSTYVAVVDASEKGRMDLLHSEACDPDDTGIEVRIAVRPQDVSDFVSRAQRLFVHFDPQPVINTTLERPKAGRDIGTLGRIFEKTDYYDRGKWVAVMGPVPYRVDLNQLGRVGDVGLAAAASNIEGVIRFGIGELQVAASREELKYGEPTRLALIERINEMIDEYVKLQLEGLDKLSPWERRLRIRSIDNMGLPTPRDREGDRKSYVHLRVPSSPPLPPLTTGSPLLRLNIRSYRGTSAGCDGVSVNRETKIVVKDDRRTVKGFHTLDSKHVIVSGENGLSGPALMSAVKRMVRESDVEGIPIVLLSSFPWTPPHKNSQVAPDPKRARAKVLVLDPSQPDWGDLPLSRHWLPAERTAASSDVYVVLESYRVDGHADWYTTYREDRRIVESLGLKMPEVIGHRETVANPIDRSKLKGTEYRAWREKGLVTLLSSVPGVAAVLEATDWVHGTSSDMSSDGLPDDHPISKFVARVNVARKVMSDASSRDTKAARHVRPGFGPPPASSERSAAELALKLTYPLFGLHAITMALMTYGNRKPWIDYIKMVDLLETLTRPEEEERQKEEAA